MSKIRNRGTKWHKCQQRAREKCSIPWEKCITPKWVYGDINIYTLSAGIDFRRQNLMFVDVKFWCLKTVLALKGSKELMMVQQPFCIGLSYIQNFQAKIIKQKIRKWIIFVCIYIIITSKWRVNPYPAELIYLNFTYLKLCFATAIHNFKYIKSGHICSIWNNTFANIDV